LPDGAAVTVDGATITKSFILWNLTIAGNGSNSATGILLQHINPNGTQGIVAAVSGSQTTIQALNVGILVESSSYVTLDSGGSNPNGPGLANTGAGTINKNLSGGIDVENSSHISVRGWQLSANGQDHSPDWMGLDPRLVYWGVGGVRFFGHADHDTKALQNRIRLFCFGSSGPIPVFLGCR
jgi:hypothetical protein